LTPMGYLLDQIEQIIKKGDAVNSKEIEGARKAFKQAINSISSEIVILRTERWTYGRTCIFLPPNLNNESIDVRIDVVLEGTLNLFLDSYKIEQLNSFDAEIISKLIVALGNASIKDLRTSLLDDNDGETTENDISTEEISRETTIVPSSGDELSDICVRDTYVYLKEDESQSVEIDAILCEIDVDDDMDELTGNIFCIGCPFADSDEAEDTLECSSVLGELEPFWGWSPSTISSDVGEKGWAYWLASRICDVI